MVGGAANKDVAANDVIRIAGRFFIGKGWGLRADAATTQSETVIFQAEVARFGKPGSSDFD
jgi:hypothetical protein